MLKKLRLHLAGICILMTGVVFFVLLALLYATAASQYRGLCATLFDNTLASFSNRLLDDTHVDAASFTAQAASKRCVVCVTNNGRPFLSGSGWIPPTPAQTLIALAQEQALARGVDISAPAPTFGDEPAAARFFLSGQNGDRYRAAVIVFPLREKEWLSLTVLKDMGPETRYLRHLLLRYALLSLAVFAALCLMSWLLAGRAVRPTAESLERQKAFIASASHELRSPVAVIATSASAIRVDPTQTEEMLSSIESECTLLTHLVDDLLLLANMDTASWKLTKRTVEADTVLLQTVEKLTPVAHKNGFSLRPTLPASELAPVLGDAERIGQILTILVDNAIKHSGVPGVIEVRGRMEGRLVLLDVVDHGKGIPPEARPRVFDRFFSVSESRHERRNFGLGLAIAAELARLHGGSLTLTETPGGGSTFRLALPAARKDP